MVRWWLIWIHNVKISNRQNYSHHQHDSTKYLSTWWSIDLFLKVWCTNPKSCALSKSEANVKDEGNHEHCCWNWHGGRCNGCFPLANLFATVLANSSPALCCPCFYLLQLNRWRSFSLINMLLIIDYSNLLIQQCKLVHIRK